MAELVVTKGEFNFIKQMLYEVSKSQTPESWLNKLIGQMKRETKPRRPGMIFFTLGGESYIEYNTKNGQLWINDDYIISKLQSKFKISIPKIEELVLNVMRNYVKPYRDPNEFSWFPESD